MKRLTYCWVLATLLAACGEDKTEETTATSPAPEQPVKTYKIDQLNWLEGTWHMQTPDGNFTEHWEKTTDTLYSGYGVMVSGKGDTLFSEHMRLAETNDTLYYIPAVSHQNDGKETVFKEKSFNGNEVVFENPAHDFPQRIIYQRPSDTTLYARIEGKMNGKDAKEEYQYKKAK